VEARPTRDPNLYYQLLDPAARGPRPAVRRAAPETSPGDDPERLKAAVATACRILAAQGTLAFFKEHVSHRMAAPDRYLMSPAKAFALMEPDDIGEIGMEGDCEWLSGPYPPAPFRWYHRDLLRSRPDVNAIVHTHELHGRALPMAGVPLAPVFRNGAAAAAAGLSIFPTPSLLFREDHRAGALQALGDGPSVHLLSHGTDYVGRSLEEALAAAIHREQLARIFALASELGTPRPLATSVVAELPTVAPTTAAWWAHYAARLG
jgi:L-fuculose-phosphate aldolase